MHNGGVRSLLRHTAGGTLSPNKLHVAAATPMLTLNAMQPPVAAAMAHRALHSSTPWLAFSCCTWLGCPGQFLFALALTNVNLGVPLQGLTTCGGRVNRGSMAFGAPPVSKVFGKATGSL